MGHYINFVLSSFFIKLNFFSRKLHDSSNLATGEDDNLTDTEDELDMQLDKSTSSYAAFLHDKMRGAEEGGGGGETFERMSSAEKCQLAPTDRYLSPPRPQNSSSSSSFPFPIEHDWLRHDYLTQQQLRWQQQRLSTVQTETVLTEKFNKK